MKLRAARLGGAFLVVAVLAFASGLYVDQAYSGSPFIPYLARHSVGNVDTSELRQAIQVIQANYVDRNLDATKLSHGTVQGLIAALNDPFSAYYDPAAFKKMQDSLQGQYTGVGIYLTFGAGYPVIAGTVPDSPAAKAGLQSGDQITKVGDQDMKGATADQATTVIQGPKDSKVILTILRGTTTFAVTITRAVNAVLFIVIVLELLRTIVARLDGGGFQLQPFLVIGIISATRHILTVGAELSLTGGQLPLVPTMTELVNAAVVVALSAALVLVRKFAGLQERV